MRRYKSNKVDLVAFQLLIRELLKKDQPQIDQPKIGQLQIKDKVTSVESFNLQKGVIKEITVDFNMFKRRKRITRIRRRKTRKTRMKIKKRRNYTRIVMFRIVEIETVN